MTSFRQRAVGTVVSMVVLWAGVDAAFAQPASAPAASATSRARTWPLTRPEATSFAETSRYDDVMVFLREMDARSAQIHLTTCGYTYEGRPMPLAVVGAPAATAEAVRRTGKTRVYIQGNIHAGEVEGKEAMLWLLRSVAKGERADWLAHVVLLINPIYNADGNERVNVRNRGAQHGPFGGMGQRHNAQDLDLNRDNTKLETAEARSMARLLIDYDPHVVIDLHTTNGSDHGFYLTYDTSANPNTAPGLAALVREGLLPAVTDAIKAKHGWSLFYYGGVSRQGERAWRSDLDLYKPRYTQTYWGLRNRIGILSEAYSYATFEDRIKATYWFVEEIVNYAAQHGPAIRKAITEADAASIVGAPQGVRHQLVKFAGTFPIVLADVVEERNPYVPDRPVRRRVTGSERVEQMPHYGLIEPTAFATAPRAYILPANLVVPTAPTSGVVATGAPQAAPPGAPSGARPGAAPPGTPPGGMVGGPGAPPFARGPQGSPLVRTMAAVVDRLEAHGIRYFKTAAPQTVTAERFRITTSTLASAEYQGTHRLRTLAGDWEPAPQEVPAGSLVIPIDQPLGRLAFMLCDPMSDDGFMTWNILDPVLGATPAPDTYPLLRTMDAVTK